MRRFFTFITCIVIAAGAVSDNGIVKVKSGENFSLSVRTSEPKIVSRFTVRRNGTQEVFRYCSPEEQNHGCKPIISGRISLRIGDENVSVTFLAANTSDEGVYGVEVIDNKNKCIQHNYSVSLTEQLPSTINPEPPSIHPFTTPAISTKGKETLETNGPNTTVSTERNYKKIWGIIGGLSGVIAVAIVVTGIICCKKKKQKKPIADDDTEDPRRVLLSTQTPMEPPLSTIIPEKIASATNSEFTAGISAVAVGAVLVVLALVVIIGAVIYRKHKKANSDNVPQEIDTEGSRWHRSQSDHSSYL